MTGLSANKKIIITVVSFVLLIAVFAVVLKFTGTGDGKDPERETTSADSGYVEALSDMSEETSISPAAATMPEMNNDVSDAVTAAIYAYMSGQYYIDGKMYSGGEITEVSLAISGKDFYTSADIEGMSVSILYKGNKIYFIKNDTKQYIELSDVLLDSYDIDLSEMEELTEYFNLTQYNFTGFDRYSSKVDGQTADCFKYYNDDMSVVFYFVDDELKQIDMGDGNGNANSTVTVNEFSPEVPAGMMSLSGLTRTTLLGFFGESIK